MREEASRSSKTSLKRLQFSADSWVCRRVYVGSKAGTHLSPPAPVLSSPLFPDCDCECVCVLGKEGAADSLGVKQCFY